MFGKKKAPLGIDPPPIATENPDAVEVLRVWAAPGAPQQLTLQPVWGDPGAWGLVLADVARHAAQAYERGGQNHDEALERICAVLRAELSVPTDQAQELTEDS